jgi:tetratricopeptide (TPR) repeat protein
LPDGGIVYDCYLGLGQIALRTGRREEAVAYFEKAAQVLPAKSEAYDALGSVYFPLREFAKAAQYFWQAVRANPQDLGARFYLGTCLMQLGKYREAAEQFRAARLVDRSYRESYQAEARALEAAGDSQEAEGVRGLLRDE